MAHTKAKSTTKLGRDSESKRLGLKVGSGQKVKPGMILVRQRGSQYFPGDNVLLGKDDTLFAGSEGVVEFSQKSKRRFSGRTLLRTYITVRASSNSK